MTDPVERLAALIRIPNVSHRDAGLVDTDAFDRLLDELRTQYPLVHEHLEMTRVHTHGLLFRWPGRHDDRPVVLMAHLDVVPVEGTWQHPPFSGAVVDGTTWPRAVAAGLDPEGALGGCDSARPLEALGCLVRGPGTSNLLDLHLLTVGG